MPLLETICKLVLNDVHSHSDFSSIYFNCLVLFTNLHFFYHYITLMYDHGRMQFTY